MPGMPPIPFRHDAALMGKRLSKQVPLFDAVISFRLHAFGCTGSSDHLSFLGRPGRKRAKHLKGLRKLAAASRLAFP